MMYADKIFEKSWHLLPDDFPSGFNMRVMGYRRNELMQRERPSLGLIAGYEKAEKMIINGEIYYQHIFPHGSCPEMSFKYGDSDVCNRCNRNNLSKPWWNIRVQADGGSFICMGEAFINLQESDNYAFGRTREEAISNYYLLMSAAPKVEGV